MPDNEREIMLTQLIVLAEGYAEARCNLQACVNTPGVDCSKARAAAERTRALFGNELDAYIDACIERYLAARLLIAQRSQ